MSVVYSTLRQEYLFIQLLLLILITLHMRAKSNNYIFGNVIHLC